jgi:hypothetical protein
MNEIRYQEIMWGEMRPDCYAGKTCDQIKPQWWCYAEGDMQDDTGPDPIRLKAKHFPPGTKVVVSVPICPKCGESADMALDFTTGKMGKCDCGFNWEEWARDQYS